MRVLVCGGRDFRDRAWLYAGLDLLHEVTGGITELIEGGASGADCLAANWAIWRGSYGDLKHTTVAAQWSRYGRRAGYIRNAEMTGLNPDLVLATPGGKGTANMIAQAKARGIKVIYLERMPVTKGRHPKVSPPALEF